MVLQPHPTYPIHFRFTFDGKVTVHLEVLKETDVIKLHINDIEIDDSSIKLEDDKGASVAIGKWDHDKDRQFFILPVSAQLAEGTVTHSNKGIQGTCYRWIFIIAYLSQFCFFFKWKLVR